MICLDFSSSWVSKPYVEEVAGVLDAALVDEAERDSQVACAASASDAVDVVFDGLGKVVVDHVLDVFDV
jgi:NADPH-dependent curcumin reductase CurA